MTTMRLTLPDVRPFVKAYYALPGNEAGGRLHVVLDDGNIDDSHILGCRDECEKADDFAGKALCDLLRGLTKTQRRKLCREIL